ncbi:MAG: hypothetical protein JNM96_02100, partial [Bacteroidia bacterium]|nr:hypothetical protein [Bacteroidia bacterium]
MSQDEKRSRKPILFWIFIILLLGTNAITAWLWWQEKNKLAEKEILIETVYVEKETLQTDLAALKNDYENLHTNNTALNAEIEEKKKRIEELMEEAKKHKGDAYIIAKLKKETETLREIMKGFVRTIDSLNTLNQNLIVEKKQVLKQLDEEKVKQGELEKEKQELKNTIVKGSILTCFNITAKAVQLKKGGKKEVETSKARKTDRIKVSFSLGENKIAKAEEKTIYIRIMTPDGKEMAKSYDDSYKFVFN